ncbi:MAG: lycopene cyclase domain-containing protein [Candidatus Saccharibacteria bacterium]
MEFKNFTYLGLLIISLVVPLIQSFDKRKQLGSKIKYILPAIFITSFFFLIWDINFTRYGIWSFHLEYTLGKTIKGLPVEEWLFFPVVLYCCVFIYEIVKTDLQKYDYPRISLLVSLLLITSFAITSFYFKNRSYTFLAFLLPSVFLTYILLRKLLKPNLTKFYFCYLFSLIPFLIIYGILAALPLVEYHPDHILGIRILNIPMEDFAYFFLMILMVITIYELLKEKKFY